MSEKKTYSDPLFRLVPFASLPMETKVDIAHEIMVLPEVAAHEGVPSIGWTWETMLQELQGSITDNPNTHSPLDDPLLVWTAQLPVRTITDFHHATSDLAVTEYGKQLWESEPPPLLVEDRKFVTGGNRLTAALRVGKFSLPFVDVGTLKRMDWKAWLNGETNKTHPVESNRALIERPRSPYPLAAYVGYPGDVTKFERAQHADDPVKNVFEKFYTEEGSASIGRGGTMYRVELNVDVDDLLDLDLPLSAQPRAAAKLRGDGALPEVVFHPEEVANRMFPKDSALQGERKALTVLNRLEKEGLIEKGHEGSAEKGFDVWTLGERARNRVGDRLPSLEVIAEERGRMTSYLPTADEPENTALQA